MIQREELVCMFASNSNSNGVEQRKIWVGQDALRMEPFEINNGPICRVLL